MFPGTIRKTVVFSLATFLSVAAVSGELIAPTPLSSNLTVRVERVGTMPLTPGDNIASPQPYGNRELFLISHRPTKVFSLETKGEKKGLISEIYNDSDTPAGIDPAGSFALMNVAGNAAQNKVYMVITSRTRPDSIPVLNLPEPDNDPSGGYEDFLFIDTFDPANGFGNSNGGSGPLFNRNIYDIDAPNYTLFGGNIPVEVVFQVFIEFDYKNGVLSNPVPFLALETQEGPFHSGGGVACYA